MPVSLENQTFYNPAAATGRKAANRGHRVREGGPFTAILKVPLSPPLPQEAHDSQPSPAALGGRKLMPSSSQAMMSLMFSMAGPTYLSSQLTSSCRMRAPRLNPAVLTVQVYA